MNILRRIESYMGLKTYCKEKLVIDCIEINKKI